MPDDHFESVKSLVEGFQEHIDQFKSLDHLFFDKQPIIHVIEQNSDESEELHKLKLVNLPPPKMRWLVNRAFKDYRDVLDQALFAASWVVMGRRPKGIHFPFGNSRDDFESVFEVKRYKPIPKSLIPTLRAFEPYPTGDGYAGGNSLLKALNVMVQPTKHEILLNVSTQPVGYAIEGFESDGPMQIYAPGPFRKGPIGNGFTLQEAEIPLFSCSPLSQSKPQMHPSFAITFGDVPAGASYFASLAVGTAMQRTSAEVTRIAGILEAEAIKIAAVI